MWLNDDLDWKDQIKAVRGKGEAAVQQLNGLWVGQKVGLRVKKNVWKGVVRPKMDYGGEVWWTDSKQEASLESVQIQAAGKWLACSSKTTREVIWGDLGLEPLKVRREIGKLKEWGKMCAMGEERLEKVVWNLRCRFPGRRRSWDSVTWECIQKYDLREEADLLMGGELELGEWEIAVRRKCKEGVVKAWREGVGCKSKLRRYERVKEGRWGLEEWMLGEWSKDKKLKFRWRSGSCGLNEDMGRREGGSRVCEACKSSDETVEHVMWECEGYEKLRQEFCAVMEMEAQKTSETEWWQGFLEASFEERTRLVLGGKVDSRCGRVQSPLKVGLMLETIGLQLIRKMHVHRTQLVYGCCPQSYYINCGGSQSTFSTKPMVSCHN